MLNTGFKGQAYFKICLKIRDEDFTRLYDAMLLPSFRYQLFFQFIFLENIRRFGIDKIEEDRCSCILPTFLFYFHSYSHDTILMKDIKSIPRSANFFFVFFV